MTRINTNVSSLTAQLTLSQSNDALQTALTRLSTGLRINTGKDDPAGLIASQTLGTDIVSTQQAITNSQRAGQMISTADSALSQVASLLTDIRSLVTASANAGVVSADQIAANQLQVDSSLQALNTIAQSTSFQGRNLLDGSLAFNTSAWTNQNKVTDLAINQVNLGTATNMATSIVVGTAATQATVTNTIPAGAAASKATTTLTFSDTSKLTVTAQANGPTLNGVQVVFVNDTTNLAAGKALATFNGTNKLTITHNGDVAIATLAAAVTAANGGTLFTGGVAGGGVGFVQANDAAVTGTTTGGANATQGLLDSLVMEVGGANGSQMFNFQTGATTDQIAAAITAVKDATGVSAANVAGVLTLTSTGYGKDAFANVTVVSEGTNGTFAQNFGGGTTRATGTDVVATVNGINATGAGNTLSLNSSNLSLQATVAAGFTGTISFTIGDNSGSAANAGGAMFQLGPKVVSNQQTRIGINSVDTASLGGVDGRLYELGSGQDAALATNPNKAALIINEVLTKIASLRGRLGAFQKDTIDTNVNTLSTTMQNLTDAQSSIKDTDFAAETANLTRAQILVQAGTSVLGIANKNPENVLNLLK